MAHYAADSMHRAVVHREEEPHRQAGVNRLRFFDICAAAAVDQFDCLCHFFRIEFFILPRLPFRRNVELDRRNVRRIQLLRPDKAAALRPRIRQKAHGHDHDREHRRGCDPKRGLFVVQRAFHARFDVPLAERQWAGRDGSFRRGAGQQRLRIVRARRTVQPLDDFFIARELDVAAEEHVGDPHQRIEPVQREHEVAEHLPPVVAAGEVRALVRDDIRRRPLVHVHGKINVRLHHAEDERRIDEFALVDVISQQNRRCELLFQFSRAHERVDEQRRHAGEPEDAVDVEVHLRLLAAHADGDLRRRRQRRIRDDIKRRLLVEHRLARFGHDLARDGLGARDERERAFNRKQADKPQCDHTPEKRHDPLRRFFEDNPQHEHRQNEPACADAEVHELQKDVIHDDSPFGKGRSFSAPRQAPCRSRGSTL